ncbi:MAG: GNAT family N-acetyltransferase [Acidobacteria bacterium]|nr:GNAT family N-acetyltransferase [Acidobacteriota bacterium]
MLVLPVSDQIILQVPGQEAAAETAALVRRNLEHLQAWMPWAVDDYSTKHAAEWIAAVGTVDGESSAIGFIVRENNVMIGTVGVHDIDRVNRHAKIGYWIDRDHEGKGIVTTSCRILLAYLFDTMELNRVQIHCNVDNSRSRAIPEKLGFTYEGILREVELLRGEFRDQAVYSLLKREWLANKI